MSDLIRAAVGQRRAAEPVVHILSSVEMAS